MQFERTRSQLIVIKSVLGSERNLGCEAMFDVCLKEIQGFILLRPARTLAITRLLYVRMQKQNLSQRVLTVG